MQNPFHPLTLLLWKSFDLLSMKIICLKLGWLWMSKKEVGVDVKDCYNTMENYNSSVRVLWVDVWDWLENVEW